MNPWLWGQWFLSVGCVYVVSTHSREFDILMSWNPQRSSHTGRHYQWRSHWPCLSRSHLVRAVGHQANCGVLESGHRRNKSTRWVPGKGGKRRRSRRGRVTLSVGCHGTQLLHVLTQHFHHSLTHSIKIGKQTAWRRQIRINGNRLTSIFLTLFSH